MRKPDFPTKTQPISLEKASSICNPAKEGNVAARGCEAPFKHFPLRLFDSFEPFSFVFGPGSLFQQAISPGHI